MSTIDEKQEEEEEHQIRNTPVEKQPTAVGSFKNFSAGNGSWFPRRIIATFLLVTTGRVPCVAKGGTGPTPTEPSVVLPDKSAI
jgi:hypothetical protein